MGQIVRRRKKGRPAKSDLAGRRRRRSEDGDHPPRRSLRRRNVRYNFDIDDYVDDEEFYEDGDDDDDEDDDDEDVRRREKKLRLLLKLDGGDDSESTRRRVSHAPSTTTFSPSSSSSDYHDEDDDDDDDDNKPSTKKRKISADDELDGDDEDIDERNEVRGRKVQARGADSIPGTPSDLPTGFPLPDKKSLELILDKLQKKDIYGVYAEPVDPEELPDYHDVIKNPMDFATIRNKLANGVYSTLEQFESDVFLICTNAMQYNAPDTVYYKQASSIQEMAKGKFQRLRFNAERSEVELKSEQKTASDLLLPKKQPKKLVSRTVQEPIGSDSASGATLATAGEVLNGPCAVQTTSVRPNTVDGLIAENSMLLENNVDKGEELQPGKGGCSKHGRKLATNDENRRASYNISIQPVEPQESIFSTFEGESKLLVPVGLHADHSYTRSLACFAATLGSVAWKVASQRIEQALPEGFKFGRGWVGEYEPLPTPVLMLEHCTLKDPSFITKLQYTTDIRDKEKSCTNTVPGKEIHESGHHLEGKHALFGITHNQLASKNESPRGASLDVRPAFFSSPRAKPDEFLSPRYQQQNPLSKNLVDPEKKVLKQVELNYPPPSNKSTTDFVAERQNSNGSDMRPASGSAEIVSRSRNLLPSVSFKQSINNTTDFVAERQNSNGSALHPSAEIVSRSRSLLPSASFKQTSNNATDFVAERQNSNGSDMRPASVSSEIVSRSRNLLPSVSFKQSSNNTTDFVAERQNSNGSDIRLASVSSEIVSRSRNLLPSVSFKQSSNNTTDFVAGRQNSNGSDIRPVSVSSEIVSKSRNLLPSVSFKQSSNNGFIPGGLVNGNPMMNTVDSIRTVTSSSSASNLSPMNNSNKKFPVQQDQGLSDPVQLMKMLAEKAQNQHKSSIGSPVNSHTQQVVPQVPSPREDLNNAALSASHSWMSLGASGVKVKPPTAENSGSHKHQVTPDPSHNPAYERHSRFRGESPFPGMHFQPQDKPSSYPVHPFVPQPVRMMTNEAHVFQTRPMGFPQLVTADLSRFQMMQSPWGGISSPQMQQQQQLRPKQESRPPDLNIGFQSLGSPVRQSPNVLVDSQQPDLALQL